MLALAPGACIGSRFAFRYEMPKPLALEASSWLDEFLPDVYMFAFDEESSLDCRVGCESVVEAEDDVGYFLVFVAEMRWFYIL
jgi:hypothetical protein